MFPGTNCPNNFYNLNFYKRQITTCTMFSTRYIQFTFTTTEWINLHHRHQREHLAIMQWIFMVHFLLIRFYLVKRDMTATFSAFNTLKKLGHVISCHIQHRNHHYDHQNNHTKTTKEVRCLKSKQVCHFLGPKSQIIIHPFILHSFFFSRVKRKLCNNFIPWFSSLFFLFFMIKFQLQLLLHIQPNPNYIVYAELSATAVVQYFFPD